MSDIPSSFTAEEPLPATSINRLKDTGLQIVTSGETINGGNLPVAIFLNSLSKAIACDGNDQTKLKYEGFATSNATAGVAIDIQTNGIVRGFTGLIIGVKYYVQDDKTIGTAVGTYEILVGIAITADKILILKGSMEYCGTDSGTSITVPAVARFAIIRIIYLAGTPRAGDLFVARVGKTTGRLEDPSPVGTAYYATASWSGSTITIDTNQDIVSAVAYFYR